MTGFISFVKEIISGDERFLVHRLKASRFALALGLLGMFGWFQYELMVNHVIRWDYVIILGIMALGKVGAMVYYRRTY